MLEIKNITSVLFLLFVITALIFAISMLRQVSVVNTKQLIYELVLLSMACILLVLLIIGAVIEQDWGMIACEIISLVGLLVSIRFVIGTLKKLRNTTDGKVAKGKNIDGGNIEEK